MARAPISEYAAKKLLLKDGYEGVSVTSDSIADLSTTLPIGTYVVKVDTGVKKRNKNGLVVVGLRQPDSVLQAKQFLTDGHARVLIEPMFTHGVKEEEYVSISITRSGAVVLYSRSGGVEVEEGSGDVIRIELNREEVLSGATQKATGLSPTWLAQLLERMQQYHFSFLEINPFVRSGDNSVLLDAAVLVDTTKLHQLPGWVYEHVQGGRTKSEAEERVAALDESSTAAFALTVFNPDAAIFTLLSGGGASLVTIDTLVGEGLEAEIGNYGEYSGAPTREETKMYTSELLTLLFASKAERKVLIVAGGVANFTDVLATFAGIVDACTDYLDEFSKQSVMVRVRRGGPRQAEGLKLLEDFFREAGIPAVVSDPSVTLPEVAAEAKEFLTTTS